MSDMSSGEVAMIEGNTMWNNPFVYLILLWAFRGGFGGFGDSVYSSAQQGAFTRAELYDGLEMQNIANAVQGVHDAVNSTGSAISQQLCSGFAGVNSAISNAMYNTQLGLCGIERNIDAVRAENAQNCCAVQNAIHAEGEATRALINDLETTRLRTDLQAAQLTIATGVQKNDILNQLGRYMPYGCNSCGCGYNW